jgi:hypothetical protein
MQVSSLGEDASLQQDAVAFPAADVAVSIGVKAGPDANVGSPFGMEAEPSPEESSADRMPSVEPAAPPTSWKARYWSRGVPSATHVARRSS